MTTLRVSLAVLFLVTSAQQATAVSITLEFRTAIVTELPDPDRWFGDPLPQLGETGFLSIELRDLDTTSLVRSGDDFATYEGWFEFKFVGDMGGALGVGADAADGEEAFFSLRRGETHTIAGQVYNSTDDGFGFLVIDKTATAFEGADLLDLETTLRNSDTELFNRGRWDVNDQPNNVVFGEVAPVPEPGAALLFAAGLSVIGVARRRHL